MTYVREGSVLTLSSQQAYERLYRRLCAQTGLSYDDVKFTPDPLTQTILIESREKSLNGSSGQYLGDLTINYNKIDADVLIFGHAVYVGELRLPFKLLAQRIYDELGWRIEPEDAVWSDGVTTIDPDENTLMDLRPNIDRQYKIELTMKPTSARFAAGTRLRFVCDEINKPYCLGLYSLNNQNLPNNSGYYVSAHIPYRYRVRDSKRRLTIKRRTDLPNINNVDKEMFADHLFYFANGFRIDVSKFDIEVFHEYLGLNWYLEWHFVPKDVFGQRYRDVLKVRYLNQNLGYYGWPLMLYIHTAPEYHFTWLQFRLLKEWGVKIEPFEFETTLDGIDYVLEESTVLPIGKRSIVIDLKARNHTSNFRVRPGTVPYQIHFRDLSEAP